MKRPKFIELAQLLVTLSDQFPNEPLFEAGRDTKAKQLANYLKHKVKSIGRSPICHIEMTSMEQRNKLEKLLIENKILINEGYSTDPPTPILEVYVSYFKWFNLGD